MNSYEALVQQIEVEAQSFREENQRLREGLSALIEENNRLRSENKQDPLGVFRNDYVKIADSIFNNFRNQIYQINQVLNLKIFKTFKVISKHFFIEGKRNV